MFQNNPQPAQIPRTATYVALNARRRPTHVAVLNNETKITYVELHRDLSRITHAIAGFGLAPGSIAAIGHADLYTQLLLVFGCETLGIITGSFRPVEGAECHGLLTSADLVMTENPDLARRCRCLFHITPDWLSATLKTSAPPTLVNPVVDEDHNLVILRSSGTTGTSKRMLLTRRMMNERLARQRDSVSGLGLGPESRFYAAMHFGVGSIYMAAANCFRSGATFMSAANLPGLADLAAYQPTHITMLPFHLRRLLEQMPPAATPGPLLPGLTVQTIGARLPTDLRRLALQKFCGAIRENYGANEAGSIGTVDATGLITLTPGITAEINEAGELRLRGPGVATSYMDDQAATKTMFRGGWFHPGDLAALAAPGQLRLLGRRSDVLNLGGMKYACADMEAKILTLPGISDTALTQPGNAIEPTRVTVYIVPTAKFDLRGCINNLKRIIDFPFQVQTCTTIPRNHAGKILREALQTERAA